MMLTFLAASMLAQTYYTADEARDLFKQATDAYYQQNYVAAKEGYEKLVQHGFSGPDVLYNLGTTHLVSGDVGRAVLYLERARRAGSTDEDVEANLAIARHRQVDKVIGADVTAPFIYRVAHAIHPGWVGTGLLFAWWAGMLLLFVRRWLPERRKTMALLLGGALLLISLPLGALAAAHMWVERTVQEGVVLADRLAAREQPASTGRVAFEIHAGLKVRLLEREGPFVRIRLPNGLVGWTAAEGISEI